MNDKTHTPLDQAIEADIDLDPNDDIDPQSECDSECESDLHSNSEADTEEDSDSEDLDEDEGEDEEEDEPDSEPAPDHLIESSQAAERTLARWFAYHDQKTAQSPEAIASLDMAEFERALRGLARLTSIRKTVNQLQVALEDKEYDRFVQNELNKNTDQADGDGDDDDCVYDDSDYYEAQRQKNNAPAQPAPQSGANPVSSSSDAVPVRPVQALHQIHACPTLPLDQIETILDKVSTDADALARSITAPLSREASSVPSQPELSLHESKPAIASPKNSIFPQMAPRQPDPRPFPPSPLDPPDSS